MGKLRITNNCRNISLLPSSPFFILTTTSRTCSLIFKIASELVCIAMYATCSSNSTSSSGSIFMSLTTSPNLWRKS